MNLTINAQTLEPNEGIIEAHSEDEIRLTIDLSKITTSIASPEIKLFHSADGFVSDVASTYFSSVSVNVSGTNAVLNKLSGLVDGRTYRLDLSFLGSSTDVRTSKIRLYCNNG